MNEGTQKYFFFLI